MGCVRSEELPEPFSACVRASLPCVMPHIILDDVLCYLASARNSTPKDVIIKSAERFYDEDAIILAMNELFKLGNKKNIARKSCPSHPNVNVKHVENILNLFSKKDDKLSLLPHFAAKGFASLPPTWFNIIAPVLMALRDEIASLKAEVSEQRTATQRDVRSMEHVVTVKYHVDGIKKFIHELPNHKADISDTFARIVSGPVSNRSNEPRHIPERIRSGEQPNNRGSCHHLSQGQTPASSVPAFTNLLNNGARAIRQVSNDFHLALNARPNHESASSALPTDRPTSTRRTGHDGDRPTSARSTGHDDEIVHRGTNVVA